MRNLRFRFACGALALLVAVLLPALSLAAPITGTLHIGGSSVTITPLSSVFNCSPGQPAACPAPANYGNFAVAAGTGDGASLAYTGGYIAGFSQTTAPSNQSFLVSNFLTFVSGSADIAVDLRFVYLGVSGQAQCFAAPAPGQVCTPVFPTLVTPANPLGLSALNLQNTQTGSAVSFSVAGTARRISTGESSQMNGVFTAQFDVPYQTLLSTLGAGNPVRASFSATLSAAGALPPSTDSTPPVITPQVVGTLGSNGWFRSDVSVSWNVSDPESGIASSSGCGSTNLTSDTAGTTVTCSAVNGAGLTASNSVTVKIDRNAPAVSGMPASGCTLWPPNGKLVEVATVTAADSASGVLPGSFVVTATSNEAGPGDIVVSQSGGAWVVKLAAARSGNAADRVYQISATVADVAGNSRSITAQCTVPHDQGGNK